MTGQSKLKNRPHCLSPMENSHRTESRLVPFIPLMRLTLSIPWNNLAQSNYPESSVSKGVKQRLIGGNKSRDFPLTIELKSLSTFATKPTLMSHFNWTEASLKPGAGDQSRKTPVVKLASWWPFFPLHPVMKLIKNETILCERQWPCQFSALTVTKLVLFPTFYPTSTFRH